MKDFLTTLPKNIFGCFQGRMILWHLAAMALTWVLVVSGFDWGYFCSTRSHELRSWMFPAVIIGQFLPIVLPLFLLWMGDTYKNAVMVRTGWAIGQAAFIGWLLASTYKAFTGRPHPPHDVGLDTSHVFQFGFMRGGIFWGWPSSHTTTAFAVSVTLFTLFPRKRWLGIIAILYALYVGIGVSMTIHWFSDFAAGTILGTVIGVTVGKSFLADGKN
jgi:membrane-associated phospholipid phosphatase